MSTKKARASMMHSSTKLQCAAALRPTHLKPRRLGRHVGLQSATLGALAIGLALSGCLVEAAPGEEGDDTVEQDVADDNDYRWRPKKKKPPTDTSSTATSTSTATGTTTTGTTTTTTATTTTDTTTTTTTPGSASLAEVLTQSTFDQLFLHRKDAACQGSSFTYSELLAAAARFPKFATEGSVEIRRREVAAFLAQISHETTGGWATAPDGPYAWGLCFLEEIACKGILCPQYCASSVTYPCATGQSYHGRGPIQLSWNYNYGAAGQALGYDLLRNPANVVSQARVGWETALWFWMTPQAPKPSAHDVMVGKYQPSATDLSAGRLAGFGLTTNIINGRLECGQPTPSSVADRIGYFNRYVQVLATTAGANLDCASQKSY